MDVEILNLIQRNGLLTKTVNILSDDLEAANEYLFQVLDEKELNRKSMEEKQLMLLQEKNSEIKKLSKKLEEMKEKTERIKSSQSAIIEDQKRKIGKEKKVRNEMKLEIQQLKETKLVGASYNEIIEDQKTKINFAKEKEKEMKDELEEKVKRIEILEQDIKDLKDMIEQEKSNKVEMKSSEIESKTKSQLIQTDDDFMEMKFELKRAQSQIIELEDIEKKMRSQNETLLNKIDELEKKIVFKKNDMKMKTRMLSLAKERDSWKEKTKEISMKLVKEKEKAASVAVKMKIKNKNERFVIEDLMKEHEKLKTVVILKENEIDEMKSRVSQISEENEKEIIAFRGQHEAVIQKMMQMEKEQQQKFDLLEIAEGENVEIVEINPVKKVKASEKMRVALDHPHRKYLFVRNEHYDTSGHRFEETSLKTKKSLRRHSKSSTSMKLKARNSPKKRSRRKFSFY